jgi:hypothetical protein
MSEYATIKIERFRSPDGLPTCIVDTRAGHKCRFLAVRNFGAQEVCTFGFDRDLDGPNEIGYTRPHNECEVWRDS